MPLQELIDKKELYNVAVRMCKFHVKGPQTGKGSNKVIIIISDYSFPTDKRDCKCNAQHFEDLGRGMGHNRMVEPQFYKMQVTFAETILGYYLTAPRIPPGPGRSGRGGGRLDA